jgi:MFS family permease
MPFNLLGFPRVRLFYGWYVVMGIGFALMTSSGLAFYNLAVLLDAFIRQRGFPVALASGATASYFLASGVGGVVAARTMERVDPRLVMIAGACVSSLALAAVGWLDRPSQLYAFHVLFGFCYGCCGLVPATTIVARWFDARRPLALSLASTGLSLGGIVVTPLSVYLIERHGLAAAGPWLGLAFFLGVVPAIAFVICPTPQQMGLEPDGGSRAADGPRLAPAPSIAFARAWRSRFFLGLTSAYIFTLGAQVGGIAHLFRLVSTRQGIDAAATAVALLAAASVVGRLVGGWLLLRIPARTFTLVMFALQAVALTVLAVAPTLLLLLAGSVLFGASVGNVLMLQPLLLVEAFGIRDYGRIYSLSSLVAALGVAAGPAVVGVIAQATGSYVASYLVVATCSLFGLALMSAAGSARDAGTSS